MDEHSKSQSNPDSNRRHSITRQTLRSRRLTDDAFQWWSESGPLPPLQALLVMHGIDPVSVPQDVNEALQSRSLPSEVILDFRALSRDIEEGNLRTTATETGFIGRVFVTDVARWLRLNASNRGKFDETHEYDSGGWLHLVEVTDEQSGAGPWPWGSHDTALLRALRRAAELWRTVEQGGNYDPSDITTAPTNAHVVAWLGRNGVDSQKTREVIATMLRADNLRTGPRGGQKDGSAH